MKLHYEEDFLEAAVFICASGRCAGVPPSAIARFHRERERLYRIGGADERNSRFFQLHLEWFRAWGLEKFLTAVAGEFPHLPVALRLLAFRKARSRNEEGAELFVNTETGRHGVVALRAERFEGDVSLARFLRHEFTHLHDMVEPSFGYSPELRVGNSSQQRLARERYRVLWDITIEGRLSARGCTVQTSREQHLAGFERAFAFWDEARRRAVFNELWNCPTPCHAALASIATDPRDLAHAQQPLPGGACPLCGFPTFDWMDTAELGEAALALVKREFQQWTMSAGLCRRCAEVYQVNAQTELPAYLSV